MSCTLKPSELKGPTESNEGGNKQRLDDNERGLVKVLGQTQASTDTHYQQYSVHNTSDH